MFLELISSILSSLTSGERAVIVLVLGPTLALSCLLQFEFPIWGIILAQSLLLLTTYWEILLQWNQKLSEFKVSLNIIAHIIIIMQWQCCDIVNVINFTVPAPSTITLTSSEANSVEIIGTDVTLTCSVRLNPAILGSEIFLLTVETQLFRDGIQVVLDGPTVFGTTYTYVAQLNSFGRSDYGNYNCTATVRSQPSLTYITGVDMSFDTLSITIGRFVLW